MLERITELTVAEIVVTLLAFSTGCLLIVGVHLIVRDVVARRRQARKRLDAELRPRDATRTRSGLSQGNFECLAADAYSDARGSVGQQLNDLVRQSGLRLTLAHVLAVSVGLVVVVAAVVGLALRSPWLTAVSAGVAFPLPLLYVQFRRHQRMEAIRAQLPDALELMSRILRAGQTISQAIQAVTTEFSAPIAYEFGYCSEQQNLGLSLEVALRDLARRTGLLEIRIFVLGLLVHRKSGGNLTELLDNLATIIRERFKIRGKIKALTAEGRFQAIVLLILPPAAFLLLTVVNRDYVIELLRHPYLIVISCVSMCFGMLWIRRIVHFDF